MSHFTEALYLKRKLDQLINENNSLYNTLRMLSEAADPPDVPTPSEDPAQTMLGRNFTDQAPLSRQLDPIHFQFSQYFTNYNDFYQWYMANDPAMRRTLEEAWSLMTEAQRQTFASQLTNLWDELSTILNSIGNPSQINELLTLLFNNAEATNQDVTLGQLNTIIQPQDFATLSSIMQRYRDYISSAISMLNTNRFMADIPSGNMKRFDKVISNLKTSLRIMQTAHSKIVLAMVRFNAYLHPDMDINRMMIWGRQEELELRRRLEELRNKPDITPEQISQIDDLIKQIKALANMDVSARGARFALIIVGVASLFAGGSLDGIMNWIGEFFSDVGDVIRGALQGEYDFQIGPGGFEWSNP